MILIKKVLTSTDSELTFSGQLLLSDYKFRKSDSFSKYRHSLSNIKEWIMSATDCSAVSFALQMLFKSWGIRRTLIFSKAGRYRLVVVVSSCWWLQSLMLTYTHKFNFDYRRYVYTINGRNIVPLTLLAVIQHIHKRERHWELLGSLVITCSFWKNVAALTYFGGRWQFRVEITDNTLVPSITNICWMEFWHFDNQSPNKLLE